MLHIFRSKKFARRTLFALLILIIPAFVLWGAGSVSKGPGLIGTIGKQKIRSTEFETSLQGVKIQLLLTYSNYDMFRDILRNRPLINRMAWDRLIFLYASQADGYKVTNNDVLSYLSQHPLFQKDGTFDQWTYYYIVKNTFSMEPRVFEELVRENLEVSVLQNLLYQEINISNTELNKYYHVLNDNYSISYLLIDKEAFTATAPVSEEEAKKYFETHLREFQTPTQIDIEYIEFPYTDLDTKKAATNKANELHMRVEKYPTTFEETASKHGMRYRRTGPISMDKLIPGTKSSKKVHDVAFSMDNGEVSPPLIVGESEGTIYILRKLETVAAELPSFKVVKDIVIEKLTDKQKMQLAKEKAAVIYQDISDQTLSLQKAAEELNQKVQTAENVSSNGYIDNLGPARSIIESTVGASAGDTLPPIATPKGMVITRIDIISPVSNEKFEEQQETIRTQVIKNQRRKVLQQWLEEKAPKATLKKQLDAV